MRNRFTVANLLFFLGWWDGAFVERLLERARSVGGRALIPLPPIAETLRHFGWIRRHQRSDLGQALSKVLETSLPARLRFCATGVASGLGFCYSCTQTELMRQNLWGEEDTSFDQGTVR